MRKCEYCGHENTDEALACAGCNTEFLVSTRLLRKLDPSTGPPLEARKPQIRVPMSRIELIVGILCCVTSGVGGTLGVWCIGMIGLTLIAGPMPTMPPSAYTLPAIGLALGLFVLSYSAFKHRTIRGCFWLVVPAILVSVITILGLIYVESTWLASA